MDATPEPPKWRLWQKKQSIQMGKDFIEGYLQVKTDSKKYPLVSWGWHVAPVAYVKQPNGSNKLMVFDPSLFNRPVTVNEWQQKMIHKKMECQNLRCLTSTILLVFSHAERL